MLLGNGYCSRASGEQACKWCGPEVLAVVWKVGARYAWYSLPMSSTECSLASQPHSVLQCQSLSVLARGGRVWRLRTTLHEQLERSYWISRVKHTIYCIRHTHPTTPCWLHVVRATVHCLSKCCTMDSWTTKAMWAAGWHRPMPDPNNSLPTSSRKWNDFHKVHDYLLLSSS